MEPSWNAIVLKSEENNRKTNPPILVEDSSRLKLTHTKDEIIDNIETDDLTGLYFSDAARHSLLTRDEEVQLAIEIKLGLQARTRLLDGKFSDKQRSNLAEVAQNGQSAFDKLIKANVRLVISISKRFRFRGLPFEDLIQAGNIGLIRAAKKFDHERGFKFSTYATWWIRQSIARAVSDTGQNIRIPIHINDTMGRIFKAKNQLGQELKREPSIEELAAEVDINRVELQLLFKQAAGTISLNRPAGADEDAVLGDFIPDNASPSPEEKLTLHLFQDNVRKVLDESLRPRETRILKLRYGFSGRKPMTLQEVGNLEGITRERVRQLEAQALRKLREPATLLTLKTYDL
jgi:RNA polymerase primary sigma factor